jgi:excinuclease ABC subunit A
LLHVLDRLIVHDDIAAINWNDRSTVEVKADKGLGWFLHARTAGEWLLSLCFRVRKDTFETDALDAALGLKRLDDIREIPVYGRESRVTARNLKTAWQEVTVKVWKKDEVATPAFHKFLDHALQSYLKQALAEAANPEDLMPWKKLGRKWHLMRKALPNNGRIPWDFALLEVLLPKVEAVLSDFTPDYAIRSKINWNDPKTGTLVAELQTKRSDGADLCLYCKPGLITIGSIATLGTSQEITPVRDTDCVKIRFTKVAEANSKDVEKFLKDAIQKRV